MTNVGPSLGFDPRKVGPADLARAKYQEFAEFVDENSTTLLVVGAILLVAAWHFGVSVPQLPNWMLVGIFAAIVAIPFAMPAGWSLARSLYTKEFVLISEQNPVNGDQNITHVPPEVFENMAVFSQNGERKDRDYLKEVYINGKKSYEVDAYDPENNVAVASWTAGITNSEIRQHQKAIHRAKTKQEERVDRADEVVANNPFILRDMGSAMLMQMVRVSADVEVPDGQKLTEQIEDALEGRDDAEATFGTKRWDDIDQENNEDDDDRDERATSPATSSSGSNPAQDVADAIEDTGIFGRARAQEGASDD